MSAKPLHPFLKWSQNKTTATVIVDAIDIKDDKFDIQKDKLSIEFTEKGRLYKQELALKEEVDAEKSKVEKNPHQTTIKLVKAKEGFWKGLTANDKQFASLSFDWEHFEDSEEEKEPEQAGNPFAGMGGFPGMGGMGGMPGMGGMGGMPGMGGMGGMGGLGGMGDDEDSDEEEPKNLDDLEKDQPADTADADAKTDSADVAEGEAKPASN